MEAPQRLQQGVRDRLRAVAGPAHHRPKSQTTLKSRSPLTHQSRIRQPNALATVAGSSIFLLFRKHPYQGDCAEGINPKTPR